MRQTTLTTGPLRSPRGRVTARVDRERLLLHAEGSWVEDLEWVVVAPVLLAIVAFVVSAYLDDGPQAVLSYVSIGLLAFALLALAGLYLTGVLTAVRAVVTRRGRREVRDGVGRLRRVVRGEASPTEVVLDLPRRDVLAVSEVGGGLRPSLVLGTAGGDVRLTGWPWRRHDLELVRTALGGGR